MDSDQYTKKLRFQFGVLFTIFLLLFTAFIAANQLNFIYLIGAARAFGEMADVIKTMENHKLVMQMHRENAKQRVWDEVCKIEEERRNRKGN